MIESFNISMDACESRGAVQRGLWGELVYFHRGLRSIDSRAVDCRADMYALGVTLFHAVVGEPPFPLTNRQRALELHRTAALPRPSSPVPGIPEGLERVILRLTEKSAARRYGSYEGLLHELHALAGECPRVETPPDVLGGR